MRKVSIRELKSKLSANLKDLPFQVIDGKSKKIIAQVVPLGDSDDNQIKLLLARIAELESSPFRSRDRDTSPPPQLTGRCIVPGCRGYGPHREDFEVWDETYGEMKRVPGFVCNRHYKH